MKVEVALIESRLEVAIKIFNWNPACATPMRVAEELDIKVNEFYKMSDEEFFNTIYSYVHNKDLGSLT